MTIGKKLFFWFMVPVILALVLGIITFVNSRNVDKNINVLIGEDWKRADSNMELRIGIGLLGSSVAILSEMLAYDNTNHYKEKRKETIREANRLIKFGKAKFIDGFEKLVELEKQTPDVFKLKYSTIEVKQRYDTMIDALDKMKKSFLAGNTITALSIKKKEFDPHLLELQVTLLEEAEEFADAIVEASEMKITKITATSVKTGTALTIVIVIVGLVFSFIISRVISKPIIKLRNMTIEIGKGKFDNQIEIKSNDEIGQLSDSFNKMIIYLKKFRDNLEQSEERYRDLIENCSEIIYQTDKKRFFAGANKTMLNKLGFPSEELLGMRIDNIVPDNEREKIIKHTQEVIENGIDSIETKFLTKEGEVIHVEINSTAMYDSKGNFIQARTYVHDITERKKAEEKLNIYQDRLKSLASELSFTEERERRHIAEELHDHIGQTLAVIKMKIQALRKLESSIKPNCVMDEILELLEKTIQDTRSLTFELSPPALYELGFEPAVERLIEQYQERHGIVVDFVNDGKSKPLDNDMRILLFKAVRELLANVVKHARAHKTKVFLVRGENDDIRIEVEDDGIGFNVPEYRFLGSKTGGFGLFNMRERLEHLGGHLEIMSEPGRGSRFTLIAPLKCEKETIT